MSLVCNVPSAKAYEFLGEKWPQPSTSFYVEIPGEEGLWNDAFETAMYLWGVDTLFKFYINRGTYSDPCNPYDSRNGVAFNSTLCGDDWGRGTLAVTSYLSVGSTLTETDIIFNSNEPWNVYSSPWSLYNNDFQRVAVHELGHALGLGHEDSGIPTIMESYAGDVTIPQQDDLEGVAVIYGARTVSAPTVITVPESDNDGDYVVSWTSSSTSGVSYSLEEATNSAFTEGLRTAYSGLALFATISGRETAVSYYYRVKATKAAYVESSWMNGENGCVVTLLDSDGDGIGDNTDAFPADPAASVDSDGDGYPDSWNDGKTVDDSTTDLTLDAFPSDATENTDSDGDGVSDARDLCNGSPVGLSVNSSGCNANQLLVDSDNDGIPDYIDPNPVQFDLSPLNDDTAFVRQVYLDFLNRAPEADGLTYWVNQLEAGAFDRSELVEQYLVSAEFGETISPVVRLYFTYYQRIPDYEGLMFWVNSYAAGMSLNDISDAFATAQEFIDKYGSLSNEEFVTKMYVNVYGRQPDAEGLTFWANILDTIAMTRGQVMVEFSAADEYLSLSANQVYVTMTYMGLLRRAPEQGGFDFWVNSMDLGVSGLGLIDNFLASDEYASRFTLLP